MTWLVLHGWPEWTDFNQCEPEVMLFQAEHICGVYKSHGDFRGDLFPSTRLLLGTCEMRVQETVEQIYQLLREAFFPRDGLRRDGHIVEWRDGQAQHILDEVMGDI